MEAGSFPGRSELAIAGDRLCICKNEAVLAPATASKEEPFQHSIRKPEKALVCGGHGQKRRARPDPAGSNGRTRRIALSLSAQRSIATASGPYHVRHVDSDFYITRAAVISRS